MKYENTIEANNIFIQSSMTSKYQPFYYSNKFRIFVDKNHDVYASQKTIYDEIFDHLKSEFKVEDSEAQVLKFERPKNIIKLCEEHHFTKLSKYSYTSNIPEYLRQIINDNISTNNLGNLRKFVKNFEFETSWDFWDIIDYCVRNGSLNEKCNENIMRIPNSYYETLMNVIKIEKFEGPILNKINRLSESQAPNLPRIHSKLTREQVFDELINMFNIDVDKYRFDYSEYAKHFQMKLTLYPNLYKFNCDTTTDLIYSDGVKYDKLPVYGSTRYLITYSDKSQFNGLNSHSYEIVYTPNVQIALITGTRFIYSPNEKYYLCDNSLSNFETQDVKTIQTKYGMMKVLKKHSVKYKKYAERYTYSKYLSDLVVNESNLYKHFIKEYSQNDVHDYDVRKDLRSYEIFNRYTKSSDTMVLLIHHLICFQIVQPSDATTYSLFKDLIYDLYFLQMSYIIEIINVCSFSKILIRNKFEIEDLQIDENE